MRLSASLPCLYLFSVAALCGCDPGSPPVGPTTKPVRIGTDPHVNANDRIDRNISFNDSDIVMQLDVYELTVPFGAISRSQRFWKHIDEDHVDLETHDLLLKNGVRYGVAPNDDWDYFKTLVDHYGASAKKGSASPVKKGYLELPMRTNIESEDIFYYDSYHANVVGRSYEKCDNLLELSFEPTPRHPGDARIAVSAMVRGLREEFEVTVLNEVREIKKIHPEYLYELRLRQDVPLDHFLVIAPSKISYWPDNLGHTFFVRPGGPEPMETVLLLVPRPYQITGEAIK